MREDTIVAIATPPGPGGIGIVRISGPKARSLALSLFRPDSGRNEPLAEEAGFPVREPVFGKVIDTGRKTVLDHCLLTFFQAPHSYTGENVVEFSCHGSVPVLNRLLELLVNSGARPAARGEFTLRALLNGKIDLTQAEAVNRLVVARTLRQAEKAVSQLEGAVSGKVASIEDGLLDVISRMEGAVDFADPDEEFVDSSEAAKTLKAMGKELAGLIAGFRSANLIRDGAQVVIAGQANVGKSTLFNTILKSERAIVDPAPGTTRDYIAESIDLDGMPLTLVDTAGLREGAQGVEIEGIRRTSEQLGSADLVILVAESGKHLCKAELSLMQKLDADNTATLLVLNKADLDREKIPDAEYGVSVHHLSALTGKGVDRLLELIKSELGLSEKSFREGLVTELRQQQLFLDCRGAVCKALELLREKAHFEVVLEELNTARHALNEITGRGTDEEILDRIFSQFCIGK